MRSIILFISIALLAALAGSAFAIRMSPAAFTAQNIPIGIEFDIGIPLTIRLSTEDTSAKLFNATPLLPSEVRDEWLAGYEEIPDAGYLMIEGDGPLLVEPGEPVVRKMFIGFPDDSSLLNRHFMVQLRVMPQEVTGMFQAVLVGSYLLETKSTEDRFTRPGGQPFSAAPSLLVLDSTGRGIVRVYNNIDHALRLEARIDAPLQSDKLKVELTRGFVRGPLNERIRVIEPEFLVQAGGFMDVTVEMDESLRQGQSRNTEYLLWINEPDGKSQSCFIRIHYRP